MFRRYREIRPATSPSIVDLSSLYPRPISRTFSWIALLAFVAAIAIVPWGLPAAMLDILTILAITLLLTQSLYVLTGLAGQISLGHGGFIALGGYVSSSLMSGLDLPFPVAVLIATLAMAVTGLVLSLPAQKLGTLPMAAVTFGFGLMATYAVTTLAGMTADDGIVPDPPAVHLDNLKIFGRILDPRTYFQITAMIAASLMLVVSRLGRGCLGRALVAVRTDEIAAGTLGVSPGVAKQVAYTISGALAGLGGALLMHLSGTLMPGAFDVSQSLNLLLIVLLGGLGSLVGQTISAALVMFLLVALQTFLPAYTQIAFYGILLPLTVLLAPRGLGAWCPVPRFIDPRPLRLAGSRRTQAIPRVTGGTTTASLVAGAVSLEFGQTTVLDRVTVTLQPGRVTGLIGPEGAGKSSLIDILTGVHAPTRGGARFFSRTITHRAPHIVAGYGLRRTFQPPRLVPQFTLRENMLLGAHLRLTHDTIYSLLGLPFATQTEASVHSQINALMDMAGLTSVADQIVETLPPGSQRLAEIIRQAISNPLAMLLDDPTAGLSDPELVALNRLITGMKQAGILLMLAARNLDYIAPLVDDVVEITQGRVILRGDFSDLRANAAILSVPARPTPSPNTLARA